MKPVLPGAPQHSPNQEAISATQQRRMIETTWDKV
jgi:hypothetical protein